MHKQNVSQRPSSVAHTTQLINRGGVVGTKSDVMRSRLRTSYVMIVFGLPSCLPRNFFFLRPNWGRERGGEERRNEIEGEGGREKE